MYDGYLKLHNSIRVARFVGVARPTNSRTIPRVLSQRFPDDSTALKLLSKLAKSDPSECARGVNRSRFSHPRDDTRAAVPGPSGEKSRVRIVARLFDDNENFLSSLWLADCGWDLEIAPPLRSAPAGRL